MKRPILIGLGIVMVLAGFLLYRNFRSELRFHVEGLAEEQEKREAVGLDDADALAKLEQESEDKGISSYRYHELSTSKAPWFYLGLIAAGLLCGYIGIRSKSAPGTKPPPEEAA